MINSNYIIIEIFNRDQDLLSTRIVPQSHIKNITIDTINPFEIHTFYKVTMQLYENTITFVVSDINYETIKKAFLESKSVEIIAYEDSFQIIN